MWSEILREDPRIPMDWVSSCKFELHGEWDRAQVSVIHCGQPRIATPTQDCQLQGEEPRAPLMQRIRHCERNDVSLPKAVHETRCCWLVISHHLCRVRLPYLCLSSATLASRKAFRRCQSVSLKSSSARAKRLFMSMQAPLRRFGEVEVHTAGVVQKPHLRDPTGAALFCFRHNTLGQLESNTGWFASPRES